MEKCCTYQNVFFQKEVICRMFKFSSISLNIHLNIIIFYSKSTKYYKMLLKCNIHKFKVNIWDILIYRHSNDMYLFDNILYAKSLIFSHCNWFIAYILLCHILLVHVVSMPHSHGFEVTVSSRLPQFRLYRVHFY